MRPLCLLSILAACCFGVGAFLAACGDDDDDNDKPSGGDALADGYYEGLGQIVTDLASGRRLLFPEVDKLLGADQAWIQASSNAYDPNANLNYDHPTAVSACEQAGIKSGENWGLPSISLLRELIRGCPETEFDGPCGVYDECPSVECWDDDCNFACAVAGPGPRSDGCYSSDSLLIGACGNYWSGTRVVSDADPYEHWWTVFYSGAMIVGQNPAVAETMRVLCAAY